LSLEISFAIRLSIFDLMSPGGVGILRVGAAGRTVRPAALQRRVDFVQRENSALWPDELIMPELTSDYRSACNN
jgi:hypothetical protein